MHGGHEMGMASYHIGDEVHGQQHDLAARAKLMPEGIV
jgi:hypothetical protein